MVPLVLDLVSVDNLYGETVITIQPPYNPEIDNFIDVPKEGNGKIYQTGENYNIIVKNFARRSDVLKNYHQPPN